MMKPRMIKNLLNSDPFMWIWFKHFIDEITKFLRMSVFLLIEFCKHRMELRPEFIMVSFEKMFIALISFECATPKGQLIEHNYEKCHSKSEYITRFFIRSWSWSLSLEQLNQLWCYILLTSQFPIFLEILDFHLFPESLRKLWVSFECIWFR